MCSQTPICFIYSIFNENVVVEVIAIIMRSIQQQVDMHLAAFINININARVSSSNNHINIF